ncbi:MAG: hypothetical protein KF700_02260 [Hyphomonadaceae bacterium]|nr:hypothetical protein [Hyphomonadaceae bacterium]
MCARLTPQTPPKSRWGAEVLAFAVDTVRANAPLAIVMLLLGGAGVSFALGVFRASWAAASLAALGALAVAIDLAVRVLVQHEALPAPLAGLSSDGAGVFCVLVLTLAAALTVLGGAATIRSDHGAAGAVALALALVSASGWCAALLARDWVVMVIGAEAGWLSGAGLIALSGERERGALNGALRMLAAGGAGAAFMLIGVGLIGAGAGDLNVATLSALETQAPASVAVGVVLVLVSLAIKAGVAPLHAWTGAALGRAGSFAALSVGAVSMVGAMALIARVSAHAVATPDVGDGVTLVLAALGAASVAIGSVQAIGAQTLPRLAGYALGAQAGCVLITLALGSPAALAAALLQVLAACASALALLGGAAGGGDTRAFSALDGLSRRAPMAAAAMAAGALGLISAPLTLGFLGRWRMIETAVGVGWWWAALAAIGASLAGVFYGGRLIERVYFRRAGDVSDAQPPAWGLTLAPLLLIAIALNALGVDPAILLRAAAHAAALTSAGAP